MSEDWADEIVGRILAMGEDRAVEEDIAQALRDERERAAKICEDHAERCAEMRSGTKSPFLTSAMTDVARTLAKQIREQSS